ncbi:MAG: ATP-binding cassette domain-containing protein [Gammaproteobacteria bacterium]
MWQELSDGLDIIKVGNAQTPSVSCVRTIFRFQRGTDQQKIIGQLSGGRRSRVHLAETLLKSGGNLLLLDEPC